MLIGTDVRMEAADWTELEGGVMCLFQVEAHLRREDTRVVMATKSVTNKQNM